MRSVCVVEEFLEMIYRYIKDPYDVAIRVSGLVKCFPKYDWELTVTCPKENIKENQPFSF
jgi:hypothetical protein